MSVVQFRQTEKSDPHLSGKARCAVCKHEHVAVAPVGVDWMECPECGLDKARFIHDAVPNEDIRECKCGCDVFRITRTASFCINCGNGQSF